jgi:hypothetical protein
MSVIVLLPTSRALVGLAWSGCGSTVGWPPRPEDLERPPASIRALADLPGVLGVASERRSC